MRCVLISIFSLLTLSLFAQKESTITVNIEPYLEFEAYEHFDRLILKSPNKRIELIKGFNFEWGYRYQLKVKETQYAERLSDGTLYEHKLIKVISKKKVANETEFTLYTSSEGLLRITKQQDTPSEEVYLYLENIEIAVPKSLKKTIDKHVFEGKYAKCRYVFVNSKRIRFVGVID